MAIQLVGQPVLDRTDHVWKRTKAGYKCLLCGGVTRDEPPEYPTDPGFAPDRYDPLTEKERSLVPPV
jgi:hypothetical protein